MFETTTPNPPIPFDPVNGPRLMTLLGYEVTHNEAHWEDVGGPENGPMLSGHPAYDEWRRDNHVVIVVDGAVQEAFADQPVPANFPF